MEILLQISRSSVARKEYDPERLSILEFPPVSAPGQFDQLSSEAKQILPQHFIGRHLHEMCAGRSVSSTPERPSVVVCLSVRHRAQQPQQRRYKFVASGGDIIIGREIQFRSVCKSYNIHYVMDMDLHSHILVGNHNNTTALVLP